jgi:hypothetical protein
MKELKFSEISLDDFSKIYQEMNNLVRKDLEGETFFSGSHTVYGEITLYQPKGSKKAIMLQHDKPISETRFDIPEYCISLIA